MDSTATSHEPATRRVAVVLLLVAASLGVASALHLLGAARGRPPFDPSGAGIAEAVIGVALVAGAVAMLRAPSRARGAGVAVTAFAVAGFLVGLNFTVRGGDLPDLAYHATVLPVLIGCLIAQLRS